MKYLRLCLGAILVSYAVLAEKNWPLPAWLTQKNIENFTIGFTSGAIHGLMNQVLTNMPTNIDNEDLNNLTISATTMAGALYLHKTYHNIQNATVLGHSAGQLLAESIKLEKDGENGLDVYKARLTFNLIPALLLVWNAFKGVSLCEQRSITIRLEE